MGQDWKQVETELGALMPGGDIALEALSVHAPLANDMKRSSSEYTELALKQIAKALADDNVAPGDD